MQVSKTVYPKKTYKKYKKGYVPYPVKEYVKSAISRNIENKIIWEPLINNMSSISGLGWSVQNFLPGQGTGYSQRVGNRVTIKYVEVRGVILGGQDDSVWDDNYNVMRAVLATYDGTVTPLAGVGMNSLIQKNVSTGTGLIKKYKDKYITLSTVGYSEYLQSFIPRPIKFVMKKYFKKGLTITFADNTTSYPDKKLIFGVLSDSSAPPNPGFIHGWYKVVFEDA